MKYLVDIVIGIVLAVIKAIQEPTKITWFKYNKERVEDIKNEIDKSRKENSSFQSPVNPSSNDERVQ